MGRLERFCVFRVDDQVLGIEVGTVQEVIRDRRITPVPRAPAAVLGLINLRGEIVPALDLRRCLGLPPAPRRSATMVVFRPGEEDLSLVVDEVLEVREIDTDDFEPLPPTLQTTGRELIRGTHPLDDRLLLWLDGSKLLEAVST